MRLKNNAKKLSGIEVSIVGDVSQLYLPGLKARQTLINVLHHCSAFDTTIQLSKNLLLTERDK
jgi:hypothetical protein